MYSHTPGVGLMPPGEVLLSRVQLYTDCPSLWHLDIMNRAVSVNIVFLLCKADET